MKSYVPTSWLSSVLLGAVGAGCAGRSDLSTLIRSTREAVQKTRPRSDLSNVQVEVLGETTDLARLAKDLRGSPGFLDMDEIVKEQSEALVRLQLLDAPTVERIRQKFGNIDPTMADADGVAIPLKDLVRIRQEAASMEVLAHEFGHIACHRMGHDEAGRRRICLLGVDGAKVDPAWVDLDALIFLWALGEAEAQSTAAAAVAYHAGGPGGLGDLWKTKVEVDLSKGGMEITGPASIKRADGTTIVEVKSGEKYRSPPEDFLTTLGYLAYEGSLAAVLARHQGDEGLEGTLERLWKEASFTTRELLFPEEPSKQSRLAART